MRTESIYLRGYSPGALTTLVPSKRAQALSPSPTLAITARARQMKAEGIDVISFAAGEPDFNTPGLVCEAAVEAIHRGDTKYTPSAGTPALRAAVVEKLARENGIKAKPSEVVVSCGAKHSLANAMLALLDPGDEVILCAPYWMTYADQVRLAGGVPVVVHATAETGYVPSYDQIKAAVGARTKALVLNSPSNPTGGAMTRAQIKDAAALALRFGFWVISDEIYERLTYGHDHVSIASLGQEIAAQTITITGCSKTYAMTGWRIGFAHAPEPIAQAMSNIQDQVTSNAASFAQAGAIAALQMPPDQVEKMRAEFEGRRDLIVGRLNQIPGVSCALPKGAFYAFADVSAHLNGPITDDAGLAAWLLEEAGIACVPGSVFEGPGHIRFSYTASRDSISLGMDRLADALSRLSKAGG